MGFVGAIELVLSVLEFGCSVALRGRRELATYVVVVGVAHLETTVPRRADAAVVVAGDVLEGVAALPLATIPPRVALHGVGRGEVIPGTDQAYGLYRRLGLSCRC